MTFELNGYYTLILAVIVLLVGRAMTNRIKFLADYHIPEPVSGGLVAAFIVSMLHVWAGLEFQFDEGLQSAFMLIFFASIGLSADFTRLKAGGKPLVIFLVLVSIFILFQDIVGVGMASAMGLKPLMGLVTGSITLTGGHGTAGAWGPIFEESYGLTGATTLGIAVATFGLVAGGLIGGPVARYLIKHKIKAEAGDKLGDDAPPANGEAASDSQAVQGQNAPFNDPEQKRLITSTSGIETLALFAVCLASADLLGGWTEGTVIELPTFVWALGTGVVLRNVLTHLFSFDMFDRAIDVFGNASLSLFLAMALLSLKLWELTDLALPVLIILAVQVVMIMLFAAFVTFRVMGSNYDAAVLAAGHCGFGMGATPTAIANMQAITDHFGNSYKAYLIVPMVGAFFVDLVNNAILQTFTQLPFLQ